MGRHGRSQIPGGAAGRDRSQPCGTEREIGVLGEAAQGVECSPARRLDKPIECMIACFLCVISIVRGVGYTVGTAVIILYANRTEGDPDQTHQRAKRHLVWADGREQNLPPNMRGNNRSTSAVCPRKSSVSSFFVKAFVAAAHPH